MGGISAFVVSLALLAGCTENGAVRASGPAIPTAPAPTPTPAPVGGALTGNLVPVHDPAIIEIDGQFLAVSTANRGDGYAFLPARISKDLRQWTYAGPILSEIPQAASQAVEQTGGIWAPDLFLHEGELRLYYSVSRFGENDSAIGMLSNTRFNPSAPSEGWEDRGLVFESGPADDYNAIDPNILEDAEGRQWMSFGSFWSGIKLVELDPATGRVLEGAELISIARRPTPGAIEAPFIVRHGDFYYLFAAFDSCCRGVNSTYKTVVGRSANPAGPYFDRDGVAMMDGGGTIILDDRSEAGTGFVGPGHPAVLSTGGSDYLVYHAYNTAADGAPTLRIKRINWTADGWPEPVRLEPAPTGTAP